MSIQAVIFDRDGTLLHFDQSAIEHLTRRMVSIAPQVSPTQLNAHWENWAGPWPRTLGEEPQFWRMFWQPLATQYYLNHQQVTHLCIISAEYYTCFRRFQDTLPCLTALHSAGIKLAILTNFEMASVERTLTYCNIDTALFSGLFSSGTTGFHKPDPRAFLAVTDSLQIPPDECGYIDDQIEHVLVARSLGMHAFWLDRSRSTADLTAGILHSLSPATQLFVTPFVRSIAP